MPLYEYYCTRCAAKFELLRLITNADEAAKCPKGHRTATRMLSVFARVGRADGDVFEQMPSAGGCSCGGGGCGCGH